MSSWAPRRVLLILGVCTKASCILTFGLASMITFSRTRMRTSRRVTLDGPRSGAACARGRSIRIVWRRRGLSGPAPSTPTAAGHLAAGPADAIGQLLGYGEAPLRWAAQRAGLRAVLQAARPTGAAGVPSALDGGVGLPGRAVPRGPGEGAPRSSGVGRADRPPGITSSAGCLGEARDVQALHPGAAKGCIYRPPTAAAAPQQYARSRRSAGGSWQRASRAAVDDAAPGFCPVPCAGGSSASLT